MIYLCAIIPIVFIGGFIARSLLSPPSRAEQPVERTLDDRARQYRLRRMEREHLRECPFCKGLVGEIVPICPTCQREIDWVESPVLPLAPRYLSPQVQQDIEQGHIVVCPICQRLNSPHRAACKTCGTPLPQKF